MSAGTLGYSNISHQIIRHESVLFIYEKGLIEGKCQGAEACLNISVGSPVHLVTVCENKIRNKYGGYFFLIAANSNRFDKHGY